MIHISNITKTAVTFELSTYWSSKTITLLVLVANIEQLYIVLLLQACLVASWISNQWIQLNEANLYVLILYYNKCFSNENVNINVLCFLFRSSWMNPDCLSTVLVSCLIMVDSCSIFSAWLWTKVTTSCKKYFSEIIFFCCTFLCKIYKSNEQQAEDIFIVWCLNHT